MTRHEYDKLQKLIKKWEHSDEGIEYLTEFEQGKECGLEDAANDLKYFIYHEIDMVED